VGVKERVYFDENAEGDKIMGLNKIEVPIHTIPSHGRHRPVRRQWSGQWRTQEFFSGGSTNSVEDIGQRERGSGGGSP
jgi:hypothetical protein